MNDSAEKPRYIETVASRGYRFVASINANPGRIESLAVMPLESLSHDPEQEYFAEGLTEALINTLAKIGELRVVSRTSAMQYKGVRKPLSEIALELGVDAIVEGSVLRAGDRVRITAQLIDAPRETHLWAESYERDLRDVLALQAEVVQAIAREIRVKLTPVDHARFAKVRPVDPEAYDAYLRGRYHFNRRSGEGLGKAAQWFQQAIAKDRYYAAAYAGLADCLSMLSAWGFVSPDEGCGKGKGLAWKAVQLEPSSAEACASLTFARIWFDYDFSTAERQFERSIALDPRYAPAHHWFGLYLGAVVGRFEEAYTEFQRAIRLGPLTSISSTMLGYTYYSAHRYDQAIEYEKTLELDPTFSLAHWGLGMAYGFKSRHKAAVVSMKKGMQLSGNAPPFVAGLGDVYAAAGHRDEAQKILQKLQELSQQRYVTPYLVARICAALAQKDEVLRWLETAYREREVGVAALRFAPHIVLMLEGPQKNNLAVADGRVSGRMVASLIVFPSQSFEARDFHSNRGATPL